MWLLSYFKRSVGNCHSALRRGIQYKKHNKKIWRKSLDSASERGMTVTNRLFEIQNNTIFSSKRGLFIPNPRKYISTNHRNRRYPHKQKQGCPACGHPCHITFRRRCAVSPYFTTTFFVVPSDIFTMFTPFAGADSSVPSRA